MTAREIIRDHAEREGWEIRHEGLLIDEYRKGSRHVRVYYSGAGFVIDASYGNTVKGRRITGRSRAHTIASLLQQRRWTTN